MVVSYGPVSQVEQSKMGTKLALITGQKHLLGIYDTCLYRKGKAACGESYAFQRLLELSNRIERQGHISHLIHEACS